MNNLQYMEDYVATGMETMYFQFFQYQYYYVTKGTKENFATSALKQYMDKAAQGGVKEAILLDWRLYCLSCEKVDSLYITDDLVGKTWTYVAPSEEEQLAIVRQLSHDGTSTYRFATKSAFYNFVACCLKEYESHSIFAGVILRDEPTYEYMGAAGDMYRAIKAYDESIEVVQNLFPMYADGRYLVQSTAGKTQERMYTEYLTAWLDATGANYLMFDSYPMQATDINSYHLDGMRIAAELCKERNLDFYLVMQTWASNYNGAPQYRVCTKEDLYWQTNMALGYGVDKFIYYSYFTITPSNSTTGYYYIEEGSFLTHKGEKTDIYYYMTDIMAEMNAFAPVIRGFEYNASATISSGCSAEYFYEQNDGFAAVERVAVGTGDAVLVSEMTDEQGYNLYMVENIIDPSSADDSVNVQVEFGEGYTFVAIYSNGEVTYQKLEAGTYSATLSAGQAVFVLPY